jgi:hypothetical protein
MKRYLSFLTMVGAALLSGFAHLAIAEPIPEYEMKAAYLYNFATFTTWPAQTGKQVRLCILGKDSFRGSLEKLTVNTASGVRISLSYLPNVQAVGNCQMLFIDASELVNAVEILQQLERTPVLTVTDNQDLFNAGVMIGLILENKRLTFDVNYAQTQNARLSISSKLLRVARKVVQ